MAFKKHTKEDVAKKRSFSWGNKTKSGKDAKSGVTLTFKDGSETTLLNPSGKATKYVMELKTGERRTNNGMVKIGEDGESLKLTEKQRAYRSGYLDAQKDSAKAYKAKKNKNKNKNKNKKVGK